MIPVVPFISAFKNTTSAQVPHKAHRTTIVKGGAMLPGALALRNIVIQANTIDEHEARQKCPHGLDCTCGSARGYRGWCWCGSRVRAAGRDSSLCGRPAGCRNLWGIKRPTI